MPARRALYQVETEGQRETWRPVSALVTGQLNQPFAVGLRRNIGK